ncbi:SDR family NAD(P)-dependent oxidoreductase [Planotetraspora sp. GP83]|uniref:SDR family NAD(P)-dependent oxidoreductase n=1 Tax=Planotetraspora sp. GP83 TaxID=3156264 RepID=UPI0035117CB2
MTMAGPEKPSSAAALFDLSGRTALVTGASRGIGVRAARILDAAGARVVLCARDTARLEEVAATLRNEPLVVTADLTSGDGVAALVGGLERHSAVVDILINNAAANVAASAIDLSEQDWDRVQGLNLRSAFLLTRALAPGMAGRGWGKVVNVASVLGFVADTHLSAYVTSKAGLLGLTRALGAEWARHGVSVNALCPGWIDTEMTADVKSRATFDQRVRRRTPIGRWGTADDLAGAFLFLSSPASDFMVGQALVVDGGLTATW